MVMNVSESYTTQSIVDGRFNVYKRTLLVVVELCVSRRIIGDGMFRAEHCRADAGSGLDNHLER